MADSPRSSEVPENAPRDPNPGFVKPGFVKRFAQRAVENVKDPLGVPERTARTLRYRRRQLNTARLFLRKEFRWETQWSNRKPEWWRRGFLSRSVTLYGLPENDPSLYINDVQRYLRTKRMVSPHLQEVLDNKFSFFLLVNSLGLESDVVDLLGVHTRGFVHPFPEAGRLEISEFLSQSLDERGHIFVKPLHGAEANGVRSLKKTPEGGYRMDGQPTSIEEMADWVREFPKPLLFEAAVAQHPEQAGLNPHSTNTIRLLTMPDVTDDWQPFIARASQRVGSVRSGHIDNWTKGGFSANVDLETGKLSAATQLPEDDSLHWFSAHPDSGAQIEGHQVPFWEETRELILDAARRLSFFEYIGWDVIISPKGPVILEANINSGMNVLQAHGPLLADPRAAAYYKLRRVI
ncbi:hypothetical protein HGQ17_08610 [Nesterenkonia sp. MY13]|uniref:Alpha-L-glutamate ligase-related protein ATP-grasp domain-containing protein n=1 Tax=Nesterenkonia sedimenti TaxID=1463632 RepID=A0A7X8YDU0_9MICC|nr:sugar-transfer associated ATP-grasp domain-containing protein [Nesterenkonia sedimenti]NLS10058.1 hypothetical protein [Nesterenkonia sedimenti]